jgi:hypothetical protein
MASNPQQAPSTYVPREILAAVFRKRDQRQASAHAALVALYGALVAELLDAGAIRSEPLAERLEQIRRLRAETVGDAPGGELLTLMIDWLRRVTSDLPCPAPPDWNEPPNVVGELSERPEPR